ncbi:uncharacterized protein [Blastocystis hominis]|uniref:Uncharacterized protein n=1 Tax=Blastocystis hominis TaxID=12968 RepID=D8M4K1_BLAHO|nr:uncharacterized protein [Blastocystis hominis]CBK22990.2 unnamed protein product [Blastocystis hominis]|eukprot:XP_012897038.1 uncharacterized protein [Blastocystis hominis]
MESRSNNMQNPQLAPPSTYVAYSTSSCQQSVGAKSNERLCSNTIDSLNDSRNPYSSVSLLPTNDIPTSQCSNSHSTSSNLHQADPTPSFMYYNNNTVSAQSTNPPSPFPNSVPSSGLMTPRSYHFSPTSIPSDIAPHYLLSSTGSRQQPFSTSLLQRSYTDVDRYSSSYRQKPNDAISMYSFQSGDSDDYSGDFSMNYPAREHSNKYPSNYPQYYSPGNPNSYPTRSPNGYPNGYPYAYYYRNEDTNGYYNSSSEIVVNDYPTDYRSNYSSHYPASYVNDLSNDFMNEYPSDYPGSYLSDYPGNYQSDYHNNYQSNYQSSYYHNNYPNNYQNEYPNGYQNRYPTVSSSNRSYPARKDPSSSRYAAFPDRSFASSSLLNPRSNGQFPSNRSFVVPQINSASPSTFSEAQQRLPGRPSPSRDNSNASFYEFDNAGHSGMPKHREPTKRFKQAVPKKRTFIRREKKRFNWC